MNKVADAYTYLQENAPNIPQKDQMHQYLIDTWLDENKATFDVKDYFSLSLSYKSNKYNFGFSTECLYTAAFINFNGFF